MYTPSFVRVLGLGGRLRWCWSLVEEVEEGAYGGLAGDLATNQGLLNLPCLCACDGKIKIRSAEKSWHTSNTPCPEFSPSVLVSPSLPFSHLTWAAVPLLKRRGKAGPGKYWGMTLLSTVGKALCSKLNLHFVRVETILEKGRESQRRVRRFNVKS